MDRASRSNDIGGCLAVHTKLQGWKKITRAGCSYSLDWTIGLTCEPKFNHNNVRIKVW